MYTVYINQTNERTTMNLNSYTLQDLCDDDFDIDEIAPYKTPIKRKPAQEWQGLEDNTKLDKERREQRLARNKTRDSLTVNTVNKGIDDV